MVGPELAALGAGHEAVDMRHYYRTNKLWSGSYFAGSFGFAPLTIVRQYIEQQNRPGWRTFGPGGLQRGLHLR